MVTFVKELQDIGLNVEDQGHPSDYIGVNIKKDNQGRYNFTQSGLIDSIIEDVGLSNVNAIRTTPAKSSTVLHSHSSSPKFDESQFVYRSAVGKLNYLAQTTRPDIMTATHMIAKYSHDPRKEHGLAIIHLVMYLKGTRHIGLRLSPDRSKGFENYVDADFSGLWNKDFAQTDPSTAKSRSGWIVFYAGCPIIWSSKLQGMVALSTTEAEYIALSQSLCDVRRLAHDGTGRRNQSPWFQRPLHRTLCVLQEFRRQLGSPRASKASQVTSKVQAHQYLLSSF